jgi:hypothetical protein
VSGVVWYTNLDHKKRHEELIFVKRYQGNEVAYPGTIIMMRLKSQRRRISRQITRE